MKRMILAAALLLGVVACGSRGGSDTEPATLVEVGDAVPSFTVEMLDGGSVSIDELRGKTVLVNFWATWCPPCNQEMKRVEKEIIERFAGEEFVFLPISRGETAETVRAWREQRGYGFDTGVDGGTEVFPLFAESGIPRNFIIDPKGRIAFCGIGYEPEEFDAMVNKIAEVIEQNR